MNQVFINPKFRDILQILFQNLFVYKKGIIWVLSLVNKYLNGYIKEYLESVKFFKIPSLDFPNLNFEDKSQFIKNAKLSFKHMMLEFGNFQVANSIETLTKKDFKYVCRSNSLDYAKLFIQNLKLIDRHGIPNSWDEMISRWKHDESCFPYQLFYMIAQCSMHQDQIEIFRYLCQILMDLPVSICDLVLKTAIRSNNLVAIKYVIEELKRPLIFFEILESFKSCNIDIVKYFFEKGGFEACEIWNDTDDEHIQIRESLLESNAEIIQYVGLKYDVNVEHHDSISIPMQLNKFDIVKLIMEKRACKISDVEAAIGINRKDMLLYLLNRIHLIDEDVQFYTQYAITERSLECLKIMYELQSSRNLAWRYVNYGVGIMESIPCDIEILKFIISNGFNVEFCCQVVSKAIKNDNLIVFEYLYNVKSENLSVLSLVDKCKEMMKYKSWKCMHFLFTKDKILNLLPKSLMGEILYLCQKFDQQEIVSLVSNFYLKRKLQEDDPNFNESKRNKY